MKRPGPASGGVEGTDLGRGGRAGLFPHPSDEPGKKEGAPLPSPITCHPKHPLRHETSAGTAAGQGSRPGCGARAAPSPRTGLGGAVPTPSIPRGGSDRAPSRAEIVPAGRAWALPGPSDSRCLPQLPIQIKLIKPPIQH